VWQRPQDPGGLSTPPDGAQTQHNKWLMATFRPAQALLRAQGLYRDTVAQKRHF